MPFGFYFHYIRFTKVATKHVSKYFVTSPQTHKDSEGTIKWQKTKLSHKIPITVVVMVPLVHTCLDTKTLVGKEPLTRTLTLLGVFKTHILYKYLQNFTTVQPFRTYVIDSL